MFRSVIGSTVFYPSDPVSAERLTSRRGDFRHRPHLQLAAPREDPYTAQDKFTVGGSRRSSSPKEGDRRRAHHGL
jgi:hypothetical protein